MKFIIIGAGSVGTTLSERLVLHQHDVTLVERNEERGQKELGHLDVRLIYGNGCSPEVLLKAGIENADFFVAVANSDEANIAACVAANLLNPSIKRIARIRDITLQNEKIPSIRLREYFDLIINPDLAAAEHLLKLFKFAGAREVIDFCDGKLRVLGITIAEESPYVGKRLRDLSPLREQYPVLILGIVRANNLIVPRGSDRLLPGDIIYCIGQSDQTGNLFQMAGRKLTHGKRAMIWGGGPLGRSLAQALEREGTEVKLIVSESQSNSELIDSFDSTLVLTGEGTDQALLEEENVKEVDAFIAVTDDEEDNIIAALLAKKLGAHSSMAMVNKAMYLPLVHAIGVDVVVSSRIAAAAAIFAHIHADALVSEFSLRHLGAGFVEIVADRKMSLVGKPIRDSQMPKGLLIAAVVRGEQFFIPTGNDVIQGGDRLVIFVTKGVEKKLEKLLNIKLDFFL